ncbi:DUF4181 domain-containing protein [Gracilibacillus caseinilyticus]|uniref:DUF4181 domain-containing protein n=1 Tax=Gracilibacillus caseinilyticus TaxID=2932256 RepID=A0ABY4ER28_9BACI|nr:DUF4181 domain-containing protein [Gracilibacillus caseinilyticus]UOQ46882.1 DUF4181 domain-containing protein [Gracilibacillus caseinilyticus]
MNAYNEDPASLPALFIVLAGMLVVMWGFNKIVRKKLNVKKSILKHHLNDWHKKVDWTIRVVIIMLIILGYAVNITRPVEEKIWFLQPLYIGLFGTLVSESVNAYMEWKYAENPKQYLATVSEIYIGAVLIITLFTTDCFGLL